MKHTPGAWYYDKENNTIKVEPEGLYICQISSPHHFQSDSNARLISAAPDLLEALKIMVEQEVNYMLINNLGDPEEQQGVITSRAAIAKAEGKEGA